MAIKRPLHLIPPDSPPSKKNDNNDDKLWNGWCR